MVGALSYEAKKPENRAVGESFCLSNSEHRHQYVRYTCPVSPLGPLHADPRSPLESRP